MHHSGVVHERKTGIYGRHRCGRQIGDDQRSARARAGTAPIYYRLPDTPEGHHIKEYASGLRQLVRFVGVEEQVVKYSLF